MPERSHGPATHPPDAIRTGRVIAIGRRVPASAAPGIGAVLASGGVRAVELTLNEPEDEALAAIEALARAADDLGVLVGAGTVLSVAAARRALDAGGDRGASASG
jgi:2-keto-3-deoxy-6-phosphogluconate aldolase